jgi:3,4-dihydroxy 2-butanone 4-phosphate synthase/GTP cyclohydrolase II
MPAPVTFTRPGHIFPLVAREGGVLMRSGHTEAAVDLCKLASLPPIAVICELVNDDGTVTRGEQVDAFSVKHGLKQVSVADLIAYRQRKETLIEHGRQLRRRNRRRQGESLLLQAALGSRCIIWPLSSATFATASTFRSAASGIGGRRRVFQHDPMTAIMQRMASEGRGVDRLSARGLGRRRSSRLHGAGPIIESAKAMPRRRHARTNGWKSVLAHRF